MSKKEIPMRGVKTKDDIYNLFKIVDKLEQRISSLEKVLESHAKCIGEMREDKIKARLLYEAQSQVVN